LRSTTDALNFRARESPFEAALPDVGLGMDERDRRFAEVVEVVGLLVAGADLGAQRARKASDPILRARWLSIAGARAEQRDRLLARLAALGIPRPMHTPQAPEPQRELARLLRADLATSHSLAARCRRVGRWLRATGDEETGALLERIANESLVHASELARSLAHHYVREARSAAQ
jgi:hypothetical protein